MSDLSAKVPSECGKREGFGRLSLVDRPGSGELEAFMLKCPAYFQQRARRAQEYCGMLLRNPAENAVASRNF